ncbi:BatA domain-containing protein [Hymenobacter aerilatus]|uniref:BatA domain-containing protein n=1 Tax=Hymenobacter aerilatus TaxID=2932251 RepID=A0A8T9ST76_9BACT|nr:BatA domain-containing protein [Hymenobacter aerilatus]UOR04551.1 BatA domain-containing protein [Hymenobacter aerilatus]
MLALPLSAFHILHPTAGLLALLGLLVPLLVYLWNRRPAQVVQVGSLRWLETAANRRLRRLKPEQLLLFLLRAALVGVLALAVAGLSWQEPAPPVRGQVLLSPDLLTSPVLAAVRPSIDSLRQQGYELRQLRRGFPQVPARTWARLASPTPSLTDSLRALLPADNLWMRAQQAADSFPVRPLRVFSTAALRRFEGPRPALPANLQWQLVPTPDSARWLQAAALVGTDSLRLLLGRSTEDGTTFRRLTVQRPANGAAVRVAGLTGISYQTTANGAQLRTADSTMVPVRTTPVRVWLLTDATYAPEACYWRAAVQAVSVGLAAPLQLTAATQVPAGSLPDAVIWLKDAALPAAWQQATTPGTQVWQVGRGSGRAVSSTFVPTNTQTAVAIQRLDSLTTVARAQTIWQDAAGRPLLTRQALGAGTLYHLHTRLHSNWSALGESPALPGLLLPLLQPPVAPTHLLAHDQRTLDPHELLTTAAPTAIPVSAASTPPPATDLRPWVVLAALLLFGLERVVSLRATGRLSTATASV